MYSSSPSDAAAVCQCVKLRVPLQVPGTRAILDHYHDPLLLIGADRRILFRNAAAARVLRTRSGMSEKSGRLVLGSARTGDTLGRLLAALCLPHAEQAPQPAARGLRIARPGASRDWLAVVRPLGRAAAPRSAAPVFFVQIVGRARPRGAVPHALRDLFDLSAREHRVVAELLRTGSPVKAAARLHVTHETLRSHLKRIFAKCEVHSQEELLALLRCLAQFGAEP